MTLAPTPPPTAAAGEADVRLVAFYLPQYHPIPENDAAWGKGFTEWANVTRAKPLFEGHQQPQLPTETGFYDLRLPEVMEQQAALAREHGIHAFCYYYYWFDGRRLLEKPLEAMFASGRPDMPFCLCWANESWTRRWDGAEQDIIVRQTYSPDSFERLVLDLLPYLNDPRYLRVDGRPLIVIYRLEQIADPRQAVADMRRAAARHGLELCVAACLTFGYATPHLDDVDFAIEFPPLTLPPKDVTDQVRWTVPFRGRAYDYDALVTRYLCEPERPFPVIRTAMVNWDNTARRGLDAHLQVNANPKLFETWLSALVARTRRVDPPGRRLVFINAWNEWAEGNHLEPDQWNGRQWLRACARAVGTPDQGIDLDWALRRAEEIDERADHGDGPLRVAADIIRGLVNRLRSAEASAGHLSRIHADWLSRFAAADLRRPIAAAGMGAAVRLRRAELQGAIDHPKSSSLQLPRGRPLAVTGWLVEPGAAPDAAPRCVLSLTPIDEGGGDAVYAVADYGLERTDVAERYPLIPLEQASRCGFSIHLDATGMLPGAYTLRVGLALAAGTAYLPATIALQIV